MSASLVICSGFLVKECTVLTVAWCLYQRNILEEHDMESTSNNQRNAEKGMLTCNSKEVGNPTILLLPTTTALFPMISTPDLNNNSIQLLGAQGIKSGSLPFMARFPILRGWKPSTSFSGLTKLMILSSSTCWANITLGGIIVNISLQDVLKEW